MIKNKFALYLGLIFLSSCNPTTSIDKNQKENEQNFKKDKFKTYLNRFRKIEIGEEINLNFTDIKIEKLEVSIKKVEGFIPNYEGPLFLFGRIKNEKSNFYSVFYCTASSNYLLNLITYTKNGEIISNTEIGEGCGSDFGYSCNEILKIKNEKLFVYERREIIFNQDSLMIGKEFITEKYNYKILFSLMNNGKIKIDTLTR